MTLPLTRQQRRAIERAARKPRQATDPVLYIRQIRAALAGDPDTLECFDEALASLPGSGAQAVGDLRTPRALRARMVLAMFFARVDPAVLRDALCLVWGGAASAYHDLKLQAAAHGNCLAELLRYAELPAIAPPGEMVTLWRGAGGIPAEECARGHSWTQFRAFAVSWAVDLAVGASARAGAPRAPVLVRTVVPAEAVAGYFPRGSACDTCDEVLLLAPPDAWCVDGEPDEWLDTAARWSAILSDPVQSGVIESFIGGPDLPEVRQAGWWDAQADTLVALREALTRGLTGRDAGIAGLCELAAAAYR